MNTSFAYSNPSSNVPSCTTRRHDPDGTTPFPTYEVVERDPFRRGLVTGCSTYHGGTPVDSYAYAYDAGGRPVSRNGDSFGYDTRDQVTYAAIGTNVFTHAYDDFGRAISQSGSLADVFHHRFSSKYFDVETGFYYYGRRFYSPVLRRWLNRDPIGERGGINLYGVCKNNVVSSLDPVGRDIWVETTPAVMGFHQRVCVTRWSPVDEGGKCCKGIRYERGGKYCISFGMDGNGDGTDSFSGDGGSSDSDGSGNASVSGDESLGATGSSNFPPGFDGPNPKGDGKVYPDNKDMALERNYFLATGDDPCTDLEIMKYLQGLVGQRANYAFLFQNCRSFSQAVFNKYKKEHNK